MRNASGAIDEVSYFWHLDHGQLFSYLEPLASVDVDVLDMDIRDDA